MAAADDDLPAASSPTPTGVEADPPERPQSRREQLREAAIQAEYATGRHEDTEEEAKRHVLIRLGTIVVGFIVLIAGLAMMILPGPGVVGILAGLGILSRELVWAERMIEYVQKKAKIDELKEQPRWVQATAWAFTIAAIGVSAWYVFFADPKPELTAALPWNWD